MSVCSEQEGKKQQKRSAGCTLSFNLNEDEEDGEEEEEEG